MIEITPAIHIDDQEIEVAFIRSAGPGGQNVNKVSTAVQLRFDLAGSASLPPEVKQRLARMAGRRLTSQGTLVIEARQHRTQEQNRQAAQDRLVRLIRMALEPPRPRHRTKPTRASIARRLEAKRRRGETKRMRRDTGIDG